MKAPTTIAEVKKWHRRKAALHSKHAVEYQARAEAWELKYPDRGPCRHARFHEKAEKGIAAWHQSVVDTLSKVTP